MLLESLQWSLVDCILLKPFLLLAKFVQRTIWQHPQQLASLKLLF
ncbi:hypothetical protein E1A91_A12G168200v1 [Gossypium mustelinum]|uniref:Uncharacterized protein n=1 Tax=Gossypium mustelinum TaxID=34275 RepID=A0A5D2WVD0_GOSMU|nr:hypothetical protein E1A91_A12G168200v1 [Gossypium mustelinum]